MNWWIFGGVAVGVVVILALGQRFGFVDLVGRGRSKSSGNGSGIMGIGDEVFAPSRHEAAVELDRQTVLPAPAPLAGDGDKGLSLDSPAGRPAARYEGQVKIDLTELPRPRGKKAMDE